MIGDVPPEPFRLSIPALAAGEVSDISVTLAQPLSTTLAGSGLFSESEPKVFIASPALLEWGDQLLRYSATRVGFGLPPERRYHVFGSAWFEDTTAVDAQVLVPGEGYVLRLRGERPASWWLQSPEN